MRIFGRSKTIIELDYQKMFNLKIGGVFILNENSRFLYINSIGLSIIGYDECEPSDINVKDVFGSYFLEILETYQKAIQNKVINHDLEVLVSTKEREAFKSKIDIGIYKINNKPSYVVFMADPRPTITEVLGEEKLLHPNVLMKQLMMDQKQQFEKKVEFFDKAIANFKIPITQIMGTVDSISLINSLSPIEQLNKYIYNIRTAGENMSRVIYDIEELGNLEQDQIRPNYSNLNFRLLIQELLLEMNGSRKLAQEIELNFIGEDTIYSDALLLEKILRNLLSNAIKYSDEGTNILLEINVSSHILFIKIIDKGWGIPNADLKLVFDSFYRAEKVANIPGTGMGLYLVKRYVKLLNGSIEIDSEEKVGSTVTIEFPNTN